MEPAIRNHEWSTIPNKILTKTSTVGFKEVEALKWQRKFENNPHVYHLIVGPIFDVLRIMGRAPFYRDHRGRMEFKFFSLIMLYSILIYVVISYMAVTSIIDIVTIYQLKLKKKVKTLLTISIFIPQIITPIMHWIDMKSMQNYLQLWNEFQDNYVEVTNLKFPSINALRPKLRNIIILTLLTTVVIFVLLPDYLHGVLQYHHYIGFYFSIMGNVMHFAFWTVTARIVSNLFKEFHARFQEEISKDHGYTPKIEQYRLLWIKLSRIVRECGSSSSLHVSIFILSTTFSLLLIAYITIFNVPGRINNEQYFRMFDDIFILYFWWTALQIYCDSGYLMTESSMNHSLEAILLLKKQNSLEEELYLNIFFFTLKHYRAEATVADFYVINRSSFGSIVTSLITYIIVLIQFHVNQNI